MINEMIKTPAGNLEFENGRIVTIDGARLEALNKEQMMYELSSLAGLIKHMLEVAEIGQQNRADNWAAFSAMRDSINEHIPLPSHESDLLTGPEMSVSCEVIAEAVIEYVTKKDKT